MAVAAQRQFLVKVSGIDGYFSTKDGGDTTSDTEEVYDGGQLQPSKLASPATTENITCGRPFHPDTQSSIIKALKRQVGRGRFTVTVQPTDQDLVAIGEPTVYANALLVGQVDPEFDAGSGDGAMWELEFAVEGVA